jgi:hypothetical protein
MTTLQARTLSGYDLRRMAAVHEASHYAIAVRWRVPVVAVGFGDSGPVTEYALPADLGSATDPIQLAIRQVVAAAGPAGQRLAGWEYDPASEPTGPGQYGDYVVIALVSEALARHAPGWIPEDPFAVAGRQLRDVGTWAGVLGVARAILRRGGMLSGDEAASAAVTMYDFAPNGARAEIERYGHQVAADRWVG